MIAIIIEYETRKRASSVRSKARREVLAVRAVRLEAREGDAAAARAGEAQVEVGARRVATGRARWVVVLALPPVGRERRVSWLGLGLLKAFKVRVRANP